MVNGDVYKLRNEFPFFKHNPELCYFDSAATTQKPETVIHRISSYYESENANIHRGIYDLAEQATRFYENTRQTAADFINCNDKSEIIFTSGTTESINLLAHSLGDTLIPADEVLYTEMEHHANIVPWLQLKEKKDISLKHIPVTEDGELDLTNLEKLITEKTKIVTLTHCSNVLGTVNDIKTIISAAHKVNALVIIDAAQSVAHMPINVKELNCDFLVFSGHKICGPTGTGILWGRKQLLENMQPFLGGGDMIKSVWIDKVTWNEVPHKFEAGTPNIAGIIGLDAAFKFIKCIGWPFIEKQISALTEKAEIILNSIRDIKILGKPETRAGIFSFHHKDIHSHDMAHILNKFNVAMRAGHHCAQPLHRKMGVPSSTRLSLYFYNTIEELEALEEKLQKAVSFFV